MNPAYWFVRDHCASYVSGVKGVINLHVVFGRAKENAGGYLDILEGFLFFAVDDENEALDSLDAGYTEHALVYFGKEDVAAEWPSQSVVTSFERMEIVEQVLTQSFTNFAKVGVTICDDFSTNLDWVVGRLYNMYFRRKKSALIQAPANCS